jgi:hypothetical protein
LLFPDGPIHFPGEDGVGQGLKPSTEASGMLVDEGLGGCEQERLRGARGKSPRSEQRGDHSLSQARRKDYKEILAVRLGRKV